MYFVIVCYYNGAKIAKQCKHCTKLDLISDFFIKLVFELRLVQENRISTLFPKIFAKIAI